jgi:endonuclease YncB( thermonuclease family)
MWPHIPEFMNRPPPHQFAAQSSRGRKKQARKGKARKRKPAGGHRRRQLGIVLVLLLGVTLSQFLATGQVSWPAALLHTVTQTLKDQASNPDSGWRRIAAALENLGAAREGDPVPGFDLSGRVVRVADGDTVSLLDEGNKQYKVRLFGIDTPEQDQPHGTSAQRALAGLVNNRHVGVVVVETDDYGRKVGTLFHEGANINLAMVSRGHAWWYRHYAPHERQLAVAEEEAREQGRGLWSKPDPVPPWDWRRGRR